MNAHAIVLTMAVQICWLIAASPEQQSFGIDMTRRILQIGFQIEGLLLLAHFVLNVSRLLGSSMEGN